MNDLVWFVDENVELSNNKVAKVLEVQEESNGTSSVRSATVVTKGGKPKISVIKLAQLFCENFFLEKKDCQLRASQLQDDKLKLKRD